MILKEMFEMMSLLLIRLLP